MDIIKAEYKENYGIYPVIPLRGVVAFPKMVVHFDVLREKSVNAVKEALSKDRKIFIVTQRDVFAEDIKKEDLYSIGVLAEIRQVLRTPDDMLRVLVEGISKAKLVELDDSEDTENPYCEAAIKEINSNRRCKASAAEIEAMTRSVRDAFENYSDLLPRMPRELAASILCQDDPEKLFENIVFNADFQFADKQILLEQNDIMSRLASLLSVLVKETEVLEIESDIHSQVKDSINKNQRDMILREQMRIISSQLDESADEEDYRSRILALNLDEKTTEKLCREADRLRGIPGSSQEAFVIKNYLDTILELPWNKESKCKVSIKKAETILNKDHFGLKKVKERILESIAVHAINPDVTGQIICLVGPPGVGKTSIGKSIARALGREYVRVSLGGVRDESDIRGHRKTYVGAMPGRIINAMIQAGTKNPLILFDEIDKMSNDFRGDPSAAMLEVLDSEQNKEFRDHYTEVPFDLSKVMFITTANTTSTIPAPLLDRMEVIEITSYTREEKFHIAKEHLIPKQLKKHGLKAAQMKINDKGIYRLIDSYTREAGVRNLERNIGSLCRKTAKEIVYGNSEKINFNEKNISAYLGPEKYLPDTVSEFDETGLVNGLAWTSAGGVLMPLEVAVFDGKGNIEVTGSLGDVMKESAKIAVSYSRSVADRYSIDREFYKNKDIHIHAPEGAVPKDGPSAGVTMATAIISALSGIKVRSDVAMTGEITLHGRVLPIGGLREKTMAAYKEGIKKVIIPEKNRADLEEVDDVVKENIEFVFAKKLDDVLDNALVKE
ncbi:MAG: endopeptidase La [Oscillospiraceae bacterium]|nr:endopeptidase La [Oscillospiraceae bacterium]